MIWGESLRLSELLVHWSISLWNQVSFGLFMFGGVVIFIILNFFPMKFGVRMVHGPFGQIT